jgi:hypothetical protein
VGLHYWVIGSRHLEKKLKSEPPNRPLKMKALHSFNTLGTDYPMAEPRMPKELDPLPHRCENSGLARYFVFIKRVMFVFYGLLQPVNMYACYVTECKVQH